MAALDDLTPRDPREGDRTPPRPTPAHTPAVISGPLPQAAGAPAAVAAPHPGRRESRALLLVLAVVALGAIVAAALGWTRDPSKDRATAAEAQAVELDTTLRASRDELAAAQATITQRTGELAEANARIAKMATVTAAQVQGARLPKTFALTGSVAPGSCSLTGEACNVTTTVRNLTLSCAETRCDCTNGSCTITSDLWKTPVTLAYDAAAGRYSASGNLDADLFRCAGVPQPTTFELRLRTTSATWNADTWVASALSAELAQASQATDCLAGNRTYALTGPAA